MAISGTNLDMTRQTTIPDLCRSQARWCEKLGSPLYAHLLYRSAEDFDQGGPVRELLQPHADDPKGSALPLRMMGAVQRLALLGEVPPLQKFYPSCGGSVELEPAWSAFRGTLIERLASLQSLVSRPVQTNEVGRCGALLGGFLLIARQMGLPLRLREIGASAGLNLNWDLYYYTWPGGAWGKVDSPVVLRDVFTGTRVPPLGEVRITERGGCDPCPVDSTSPEGWLTLQSFVWADQVERMRLLRNAIDVARRFPPHVDQAGAVSWVKRGMAQPTPGVVTVLFHTLVWQYINHQERHELHGLIREMGARATADAPFAWLRMEPGPDGAEVKLGIFPGLNDQIIATAGYHHSKTLWLAECE